MQGAYSLPIIGSDDPHAMCLYFNRYWPNDIWSSYCTLDLCGFSLMSGDIKGLRVVATNLLLSNETIINVFYLWCIYLYSRVGLRLQQL